MPNRYEEIKDMSLKAMAEYFRVLAYCKMRDGSYQPCPYLGTDRTCQQCWEEYLSEEVTDGEAIPIR